MSHFTRSSFKRPLSQTTSGDETDRSQRAQKKIGTVFEAAAGRITRDGLADPSSEIPPLRPDEVLYRTRNAPPRYEEDDKYFAHNDLPSNQELPSSDLLQALHAYISEFYGRSEEFTTQKIWGSMDETALIALGILMEESAREVLGETGDFAFVEGATKSEFTELTVSSVNRRSEKESTADEEEATKIENETDEDTDDEDQSTTSSSISSSYLSGTEQA